MTDADTMAPRQTGNAVREVFPVFLRLGLTSFGGPVAHLGYFRHEFVERRRWLDDAAYADIVALCQFLPGPASSQVGMCVGLLRAGLWGAIFAWLGFTAPSAVAMILFGYGVAALPAGTTNGWLHGLMIVAVAVVAQAVWNMARVLCPDLPRAAIAITAATLIVSAPYVASQIAAILFGGFAGWYLLEPKASQSAPLIAHLHKTVSIGMLGLFGLLLLGLPLAVAATGSHVLALFDSFYRSGSLVFGGGHVVLPILQAEVVPRGWVGAEDFLAGYGAAQALPGPLFTFAAYLGTVAGPAPNGWQGGLLCLFAIFLPSFLLVIGTLPLWSRWRHHAPIQAALMGINAAVVGILGAALYTPIWTSAIFSVADFALAVAALVLLLWRVPPWAVVIIGAATGAVVL